MIRHLASVAEIVENVEEAATFYRDVLGLEVEGKFEDGYGVVKIAGTLHFGLWSRRAAAEAVFGDAGAAERIPLGFSLGLEVDDVVQDEASFAGRGISFLQSTHTEPWGQVTARFLTPSGGLAELTETPWARTIEAGTGD